MKLENPQALLASINSLSASVDSVCSDMMRDTYRIQMTYNQTVALAIDKQIQNPWYAIRNCRNSIQSLTNMTGHLPAAIGAGISTIVATDSNIAGNNSTSAADIGKGIAGYLLGKKWDDLQDNVRELFARTLVNGFRIHILSKPAFYTRWQFDTARLLSGKISFGTWFSRVADKGRSLNYVKHTNGKFYKINPEGKYSKYSKSFSNFTLVVSGLVSGIQGFSEEYKKGANLDSKTRIVNSVVEGGISAGTTIASTLVGAKIGAAIGSVIPGAGTAVGAVAGAAIGYLGDKIVHLDIIGDKSIADFAKIGANAAVDGAVALGKNIAKAGSKVAEGISKGVGNMVSGAKSIGKSIAGWFKH